MESQAVYYGSLWESGDGKQPGVPVEMRQSFVWAGRKFYVPAIYVCGEGLVIDLCRKVEPEKIRRFAHKWNLTPETDDTSLYSPLQQMQMDAESPLTLDLDITAVVNGQECWMEQSSGVVWNPCFAREEEDDMAAQLVRQHGLDPAFAWDIRRVCFAWAEENQTLCSLRLLLRESARPAPGLCFSTDGTQTDFDFTVSSTGQRHRLHIEEYLQETLEGAAPDENWEYPPHFIEMVYSLTPDLDRDRFQLRDCSNGDRARRRTPLSPSPLAEKYGLEAPVLGSSAVSVGMIGAVQEAGLAPAPLHCACSAMHFVPPSRVDWMLVFYQKGAEDIAVDLL